MGLSVWPNKKAAEVRVYLVPVARRTLFSYLALNEVTVGAAAREQGQGTGAAAPPLA